MCQVAGAPPTKGRNVDIESTSSFWPWYVTWQPFFSFDYVDLKDIFAVQLSRCLSSVKAIWWFTISILWHFEVLLCNILPDIKTRSLKSIWLTFHIKRLYNGSQYLLYCDILLNEMLPGDTSSAWCGQMITPDKFCSQKISGIGTA